MVAATPSCRAAANASSPRAVRTAASGLQVLGTFARGDHGADGLPDALGRAEQPGRRPGLAEGERDRRQVLQHAGHTPPVPQLGVQLQAAAQQRDGGGIAVHGGEQPSCSQRPGDALPEADALRERTALGQQRDRALHLSLVAGDRAEADQRPGHPFHVAEVAEAGQRGAGLRRRPGRNRAAARRRRRGSRARWPPPSGPRQPPPRPGSRRATPRPGRTGLAPGPRCRAPAARRRCPADPPARGTGASAASSRRTAGA